MTHQNMESVRGIDFHCHLDLYPDHQVAIRRCEAERVWTLAVTTTPRAWPRNQELTKHLRFVHIALGLHPQLVSERANELPLLEQFLGQTRFVGEVGLDAGPRFYRSIPLQEAVFTRILRACAEQGDKILTVHSVRTVPRVLDLIELHLPPGRGRVVLHWFTGTRAQARRAAELGCYFSVNGEMLRQASRRADICTIPRHRLLTETDGPFIQRDGRPVHPGEVAHVVDALAALSSLTPIEMADVLRCNLSVLLGEAP